MHVGVESGSIKSNLNALVRSFGSNAKSRAFEKLLLNSLGHSKDNSLHEEVLKDAVYLNLHDAHENTVERVDKLLKQCGSEINAVKLLLLLSNRGKSITEAKEKSILCRELKTYKTEDRPFRSLLSFNDAHPQNSDIKKNLGVEEISVKKDESRSEIPVVLDLASLKRALCSLMTAIHCPLFVLDSQNYTWSLSDGWQLDFCSRESLLCSIKNLFNSATQYGWILDFVREHKHNKQPIIASVAQSLTVALREYDIDVGNIFRGKVDSLIDLTHQLSPLIDGLKVLHLVCDRVREVMCMDNCVARDVLNSLYHMTSLTSPNSLPHKLIISVLLPVLNLYTRVLLDLTCGMESNWLWNVDQSAIKFTDRRMWCEGWTLVPQNIPSFIHRQICDKLMLYVKIAHVIRCCNIPMSLTEEDHVNNVDEFELLSVAPRNNEGIFEFRPFMPFECTVNETLANKCNERLEKAQGALLWHLYKECGVLEHVSNMCVLFICETGSFVTNLAESLFDYFSTTHNSLHFTPSAIGEIIDGALADCSLRRFGDCVTVSLLGMKSESVTSPHSPHYSFDSVYKSIQALVIEYRVDWPCNLVLGGKCVAWANNILIMLVELHCLEHSLNSITSFLNTQSLNPFSKRQTHRLHIYKFIMSQMVTVLKDYLCGRLQEVCADMKRDMAECSEFAVSIDSLHDIFTQHMSRAMQLCMLTHKTKPLKNILDQTLAHVLSLRAAVVTQKDICKADKVFQGFLQCRKYVIQCLERLSSLGYESSLSHLLIRFNFNKFGT